MSEDRIEKLEQRVRELEKLLSLQQAVNTNVPESCKYCSNHPSNGGSGICHCISGQQNQVIY